MLCVHVQQPVIPQVIQGGQLQQAGATLRIQAGGFQVFQIVDITGFAVVHPGAPALLEQPLLFYYAQPAVIVALIGCFVLIFVIFGHVSTPDGPVTDEWVQVAQFQLVVNTPLLYIAGGVYRVVIGGQVEINRRRDVQAAGAVVAKIRP